MNAINFIKHYGLNTAIRIIEDSQNDDFWDTGTGFYTDKNSESCVCLSDLKRLVESVEVINKFDSVQEAKDAISNSPDGATDYRKLSCTIRYIKQSERFFEYWDGSIWCRPTVPFTDETHILRFTELSRLKQAIADYESIYSNDMGDGAHIENHLNPLCKVGVK